MSLLLRFLEPWRLGNVTLFCWNQVSYFQFVAGRGHADGAPEISPGHSAWEHGSPLWSHGMI